MIIYVVNCHSCWHPFFWFSSFFVECRPHQCVPRGCLCAYEHICKLERPPGFMTSVCKSTSPQLQRVYNRLHPGQISDASSCHRDTTNNCATSRHGNWKQGPLRNLRHIANETPARSYLSGPRFDPSTTIFFVEDVTFTQALYSSLHTIITLII